MTTALLCLALTIYHEARGEPLEGQVAVAQVVMNRVQDARYPDDICSVVQQGPLNFRGNPIINECQFDWWCDGKPDTPRDLIAMRKARVVALLVLNGHFSDKVDGSTHYHALGSSPEWNLRRIKQIGQHVFYR